MQLVCKGQKEFKYDTIQQPQIDKFIGTWKWTSDTAEFIIKIKKVTITLNKPKIRENRLMGIHAYKLNGKIVEDYSDRFDTLTLVNSATIFVKAKYNGTNPDEVDGAIVDKPKDKTDYLSLVYNNSSVPGITMYLNNMGDPKKKKPKDYTFTFPSNIVLIKQQ